MENSAVGGASLDENEFAVRAHPSPVGRRTHVIGNSSSGKTTLAGRLAKALDADIVFRDENAPHCPFAAVSGVLAPDGVLMLLWGLEPHREPRATYEEAGAVGR